MISKESENLLDRMRVASPCPVSWDAMKGNDKKRFCEHCNLHVYNISSMTRREAEDLIKTTEGRLCARLYRRADGTVLTQDCPVGLKALRRRLKMRVGVFVSMLFGLSLTAFGQDEKSNEVKTNESLIKITRTIDSNNVRNSKAKITGKIFNLAEAVIPDVEVTLIDEKKGEVVSLKTDKEGSFSISQLDAGIYTLKAVAVGFWTFTKKEIEINERELLVVSVTLAAGSIGEIIIVTENEALKTPKPERILIELPIKPKKP